MDDLGVPYFRNPYYGYTGIANFQTRPYDILSKHLLMFYYVFSLGYNSPRIWYWLCHGRYIYIYTYIPFCCHCGWLGYRITLCLEHLRDDSNTFSFLKWVWDSLRSFSTCQWFRKSPFWVGRLINSVIDFTSHELGNPIGTRAEDRTWVRNNVHELGCHLPC